MTLLVVVNQRSLISRRIGDYYVKKRQVPLAQICKLNMLPDEMISRESYDKNIQGPIDSCLQKNGLAEKILYIVTTMGVPLKIAGQNNLPELQSGRRRGGFRTGRSLRPEAWHHRAD